MNNPIFLGTQHQNARAKCAFALERIGNAIFHLKRKYYFGEGLSVAQGDILLLLASRSNSKPGVSTVSAEFSLTQATISDAVRSLVQKGFVVKTTSKRDKRFTELKLTKKGLRVVRRISEWQSELVESLNCLTDGESIELMLSLMEVVGSLVTSGILSVARICYLCRFFMQVEGKPYKNYCSLLEKELPSSELRVNCEDFQKAS